MSVIRKAVRRIRRLTKRSLDCKCDDASVTEWLLIRSSFHPCLHRYQAAINRLREVRFLRSLGTSVEAQDEPPEQNNFVQTQKSNSETALNVASRKAERFLVARSTRRRWKTQTKLYFSVQTDPGLGGGGTHLTSIFLYTQPLFRPPRQMVGWILCSVVAHWCKQNTLCSLDTRKSVKCGLKISICHTV